MVYGSQLNTVANDSPRIPFNERLSSALDRVANLNTNLGDSLGKLRGHQPSVIGEKQQAGAPQPAPNFELLLNRLESLLSETESHTLEFSRII